MTKTIDVKTISKGECFLLIKNALGEETAQAVYNCFDINQVAEFTKFLIIEGYDVESD